MNSEDLKRLGQAIKSKYPEYAGASDEEVGRVIAKKYPQYAGGLTAAVVPNITKGEEKAIAAETPKLAAYNAYLQQRTVVTAQIDAARNQPELLESAHEVTISTQQNLITQNYNATTLKVDPATANQMRLEEERARIEITKTRELTAIEILKNRDLEQNRLEGYKKEVQIDLQAALGMHMLQVEKVDYIARKISELTAQTADPDRIAFLEKLRVQMERRLLETDDEEDMAGIDSPPESQSDN
jgi:hypothetical protein